MRLFAMIALAVALTGCGLLDWGDKQADFCIDHVEAVQGFGNITLPSGYTALEVTCSVFMDHHSLYARFEIPSSELAAFQAGTLVETWVFSPEAIPQTMSGFDKFLNAYAARDLDSYIYGHYAPLTPVSQDILIDTSDPARYVVYFNAFTSY